MHMTVKNGVRWSTANAYLKPALKRPNLHLVTRALTHRLTSEGRRTTGVEYSVGGEIRTAKARREVILSAGPIGSPTILQRSGIGPVDLLRSNGIEVVADRPGVGGNLMDHLEVYFQFRCTQPISLNAELSPWRKLLIGLRWILFKDGLGATNHFESCAFVRSRAGIEWPDIQYHFLPGAMRYDGNAAFDGHGFQVHVGPNKPRSRGSVTIGGAAPTDSPSIQFNYLTHDQDVEDWRRVVTITREIMAQSAMAPYRGDEIQPGVGITADADVDTWVRANVESAYHPSGTCRMGAVDDPLAVVDPDLKVIGVDGLRVVDSSIFPSITNGNLNAPTIMVGEKASDIILGKQPLAPANLPVWIAPNWQDQQRETPASSGS